MIPENMFRRPLWVIASNARKRRKYIRVLLINFRSSLNYKITLGEKGKLLLMIIGFD